MHASASHSASSRQSQPSLCSRRGGWAPARSAPRRRPRSTASTHLGLRESPFDRMRQLSVSIAAASAGCIGGVLIGRTVGRPKAQEASTAPDPPHRQFCLYGLPSDEHVVSHQGFASSLSYRLRIPNWVAEHYSHSDIDAPGVDRKHSRFGPNDAVPEHFRATNADYRGSTLSRGHMAPAGAHKQSQASLDETFLLSDNIVPQELSNNGSDWLRLERWYHIKFTESPKQTARARHRLRSCTVAPLMQQRLLLSPD